MNKRFNIYCVRNEADVFDAMDWDKYDEFLNFLNDVVKKENRKAYELYCEIYHHTRNFDDVHIVYYFNRTKKFYRTWSDGQIASAIETLIKYGFLVKVDNNTMMFHNNGNAFIKEST